MNVAENDSKHHGVDAASLPKPSGYKVLIFVPEVKKKTSGGIIIPDEIATREKTASIVGLVVKMGPSAFMDSEKFPAGAYCSEGQWIMFHSYTGTRFKVQGKDFRLINDDSVEAVVDNPDMIERA